MSRSVPDPQTRLLQIAYEQSVEECEKSLLKFTSQAWHVLEPNTTFRPHQGTVAICEVLEAVTRGELTRVKINLPPRHGKTKTVCEFWPVWEWISRPWLRYVFSSYGLDLSADASVHRRRLIQSTWFQERWGHVFKLRGDQNVKTHFENDQTGVMQATSTGGAVTGKGGNRVIIDDPTKAQDARHDLSLPTALKEAIDFYRNTLSTRLDDPTTGAIVVIMHRIHHNDLCGHLDEHEAGRWHTLCLRGEAEEDEEFKLNGRVVFTRKAGEVLDPLRFPKTILDGMRATMGSQAYAAQVQQRPSPLEGIIFNPNHWRRFRLQAGEYPSFFNVAISVDAAFKGGEDNDYVAVQLWGFTGDGRSYILDYRMDHLGYAATKAAIRGMKLKWEERGLRVHVVLIEDAANGPAIVDELGREFPVQALDTGGGKVARAFAVQPDVEAGNVYIPEDTEWGESLIQRAASFPTIKNDDDIDAMTHALNWRRRHGLGGLFALWKEEAEKLMGAKAGQASRTEGSHTAPRGLAEATSPLGKAKGRAKAESCPNCRNPNLARYATITKCDRCGWTRQGSSK